ncbi:hypothetical protein [Microlunatus sp. GCM10028923]|uniref:hypothetical protein n=1 Tax=Microlunatus sp. GCM10028923 TaxID=3273400 RepID=UPI00361FE7E5
MRTRVLGATVALILLVGTGCGTGSTPEDPAAPDPATSSSAPPAPAPSPTPEALSKDAYQKLLTGSESAVRKAFDKVMATKSIKELEAAADALAKTLASESTKLDATLAPDSATTANSALVGLLGSVPSFTASKPAANECGITPTATEQLITAKRKVHGSLPDAKRKGLSGQFKKAGYSWGGKLLPASPEPPAKKKRRADNGEVIERNGSRGDRFLKIKNDTEQDYVVAAVTKNPKKPMASVYVRADSETTLYNLAAKTYTVYYKTGTDWDDDRKTFTRGCAFQRFQLSFLPKSNWEIELKKRIGGNASTQETEPF